jgi:hypothetical protein
VKGKQAGARRLIHRVSFLRQCGRSLPCSKAGYEMKLACQSARAEVRGKRQRRQPPGRMLALHDSDPVGERSTCGQPTTWAFTTIINTNSSLTCRQRCSLCCASFACHAFHSFCHTHGLLHRSGLCPATFRSGRLCRRGSVRMSILSAVMHMGRTEDNHHVRMFLQFKEEAICAIL